jgi:hemerythrin-like domain-containing protein
MRIARRLKADQETIKRFLDVFGNAMVELSSNKLARPEFFIQAHTFIKEYIEDGFFKKEEPLIEILENVGFPPDDGPIGYMRGDQSKSREAGEHLIKAARGWQAGDEKARIDVGWAASEYATAVRQHLERLKTLIIPLIEQNIPIEEERQLAEKVGALVFDGDLQNNPEKYTRLVVTLEEELSDWR